jgi:UDP-N-acetylmuramate: L-alanyl-gamma-D-glutamyl-meso-diaminopimelate ligase
VAVTLQALRSLGGHGRLVAVFEPRSYTSRTKVFQAHFARAFAAADRVIVAAAHLPGKVPEGERLSEQDLVDGIRHHGVRADFVAGVPEIVADLAASLRSGDRVAILSNGGFGGIHERLLEALRRA